MDRLGNPRACPVIGGARTPVRAISEPAGLEPAQSPAREATLAATKTGTGELARLSAAPSGGGHQRFDTVALNGLGEPV
jgi:hypothetical protein